MLVDKLCKPIVKLVHVLQKLLCQNCDDHKLYNECRINCPNVAKKKGEPAGERATLDSAGNPSNRRVIRRQNKDFEKVDVNASPRPPAKHKTAKPAAIKKKISTKTSNHTNKTITGQNSKKIIRADQTSINSRNDKNKKKIPTNNSTIKKKKKINIKLKQKSKSINKNTKTIKVDEKHKKNKRIKTRITGTEKLKKNCSRNEKKNLDPSDLGMKKPITNYSPIFVFKKICMLIDIVMPHFVLSAIKESFIKTDLENNEVKHYVNDYIQDAKKGFKEMIFYYLCNSQEDVWREKLSQIWHCLEMCKFYILLSDGTEKKSTKVKNYIKNKTRSARKKKKKSYKFVSKTNNVKPCLPLLESVRYNPDVTMEKISSFVQKKCCFENKKMYVESKTK